MDGGLLDASAAVEEDAAAEQSSIYTYVFSFDGSTADGCAFPSGKCLPAFIGMERCRFESGSCFFLSMRSPGDEDIDMPLPPGFPPPKKHIQPVVIYDMAPPSIAPTGEPIVPAIPSGLPLPNVPGGGGILADALPGTVPRQAVPSSLPGTVGVTSAAHELQNLPPASAISPLSIVLALVAVGGGAAAWKFYSQRSSEKHEENMKKLENDQARSAQQDEQRQQKCEAAAEACGKSRKELTERCDDLAKRLSAAVERVEALEKQLRDNFSADEETVDRIKAVEQKVRTTVSKSQKAKKKPNGKKEPA